MSVEERWNDTDTGILRTVGEILYSVGGSWMNENGAVVEWYWQGKSEVLGEKSLYKVGGRWMNECGGIVEWYWEGKTEVLGKKKLYKLGGKWMNGYGAMVKWYWQGKTEVLGEKHYTEWDVGKWMSVEQWWNYIDRRNRCAGREILYIVGGRWINECGWKVEIYWQEKLKYCERNIRQCGW